MTILFAITQKRSKQPPPLPPGVAQANLILHTRHLANRITGLLRARPLEGKSFTFFDPAYPPVYNL